MLSEEAVVSRLWADIRDDLSNRLKFVQVHYKGDRHGDIPDSYLWHFTRLSALESMVHGRQVWLSDLTKSNDADEIRFGLRRVLGVLEEVSPRWANQQHAKAVVQMAREVIADLDDRHALYGFCMSEERDTAHHWGAYGGGLQVRPAADDPYVAIAFDATAMAAPLEFIKDEHPPAFLLNVVFGDEPAQELCNYWAVKARKTFELLEATSTGLLRDGATHLLKRCLLFVCALVKAEGWRGEHEFRLLYLPDFDTEPLGAPRLRPDGRGAYVPLEWEEGRCPIAAVMPHPLAALDDVERRVRALAGGAQIRVLQSELKPRAL